METGSNSRHVVVMRINVYAEELTKEVMVFRQRAKNTGIDYTGIRLFLRSPKELHTDKDDDDRSAITFFVHTAKEKQDLADVLRRMSEGVI